MLLLGTVGDMAGRLECYYAIIRNAIIRNAIIRYYRRNLLQKNTLPAAVGLRRYMSVGSTSQA